MAPQTTEPANAGFTAGFTAEITHPDWPIDVGDQWVGEQVGDEGAVVRIEITALPETLTLASGIEVRVVHDVVTEDGALVADTHDFYAQDADGNVWHLGQQTAAYAVDRVVSTDGSWEAWVDGARPGVVLLRRPLATRGDPVHHPAAPVHHRVSRRIP